MGGTQHEATCTGREQRKEADENSFPAGPKKLVPWCAQATWLQERRTTKVTGRSQGGSITRGNPEFCRTCSSPADLKHNSPSMAPL